MSDPLKARIEADIAEETRRSAMREIFAQRDAAKRESLPPSRIDVPDSGISFEPGALDADGGGDDGFDWYHAAQCDYHAVCENQTGQVVPDDVFENGRSRRREQEETTVTLAKALDSTGRFNASPYFRGDDDPSRCTVIGVFTGEPLPLPAVKRSNVLPSIAKVNRAAMLRFIEFFLNTLPGSGRKAAMFTITNGPRIQNHPVYLREGIKGFHRWLSKMAATPDFKRWGLTMEWRATEFGSPQANPESGQLEWHLHAHCLVTLPERMSHRQRGKMRKKLWRVFGVHWDDAGDVRNPREFVKYPVKDNDLKTVLRDFGPGALADFTVAIRGLHIVQPMGAVRAMRKRLKETPRRITAFSRDGGRSLEETGDWNAGKRPLAQTNKRREAYKKRVATIAARLACAAHCRAFGSAATDPTGVPVAETPVYESGETGDDSSSGSDPDRQRGDKTPPPTNRVIALLPPAPYGSPVCEPGVVVWGFDGNLAAVLNQPRVAAIIARHRRSWEDAQDARALIRACAGAQAHAADQSSQRSNNCPDDLGELALADASGSPPGYETAGIWAET